MNIVRRTFMGLGAVLVVALVLTLAAPKTVRAVVATLVTVSNTSSNPVPNSDVMRSVAQNVEVVCTSATGLNTCFLMPPTGLVQVSQSYTVPAGMNLIITNIEIADLATGPEALDVLWTPPGDAQRDENWRVPGDGAVHQFVYPSGLVVLSGSTLTVAADNPKFDAVIHGYLTAN